MRDLSTLEARRLAIAGQGLASPRPAMPGADSFAQVVKHTGLVQIDSVNVVERAHFLTFFARLGAYDRQALERWIYGVPSMFEQWGHVASLMPVQHWSMLRHRMDGDHGRWAWLEQNRPGQLAQVLEEVTQKGPVTVGGLDEPGQRTGPWWGYGPGKLALEYHFRRGALLVKERRNFARVYDIPERVLPAEVLARSPMAEQDAQRAMLLIAAGAHGVGTAKDLADYYRLKVATAKERLAELVDAGKVEQVVVEGWKEPGYMLAGVSPPADVEAHALLCPFDPLVWERARTERLFDFRYRIEIYTPQPKRVYGYYVFPFLLGTDLVGRVDLKADRKESALLVRGSYIEPGHDENQVAEALSAELGEMARWLGLEQVKVGAKGNLARALRRARR
jgi:hypothetical protein